MKLRLTTNSLLLIVNFNLFIVQFVGFIFWSSSVSDNTSSDAAQARLRAREAVDNEVLVYDDRLNGLNGPDKAPLTEATNKPTVKPEETEHTWNWNWDGRANTKSVASRYLFLVRHGQYYGNGPYEKHLSPLGQKQAMRTGERLKSYNVTFNRFISSTSIRAAETTDFIHMTIDYVDVEYSDELKEGWPAFPDPPSPGVWNKENPIFHNDMPRIKAAFEKYIHRADADMRVDSNELIVVHGNVIAYTVLRALQVPVTRWLKLAVLQGSITLLHIQPNGDVALRFLGDVGHLTKKEWTG